MTDQITLRRAVVREALEFLERGDFLYPAELSDNFRAALAAPVQEPATGKDSLQVQTEIERAVSAGREACARTVKDYLTAARFDHRHIGMGDVRLTIGDQEELYFAIRARSKE